MTIDKLNDGERLVVHSAGHCGRAALRIIDAQAAAIEQMRAHAQEVDALLAQEVTLRLHRESSLVSAKALLNAVLGCVSGRAVSGVSEHLQGKLRAFLEPK